MNTFLKFCFGTSILLFSAGFLLRSVTPAVASPVEISRPEKLLYVNIDTIDANYKAFADLSKDAGDSYARLQKQYQKKAADLQVRYDRYQEQLNTGAITPSTAVLEENAINNGMADLKSMKAELDALQAEAMEKNAVITRDVTAFFEKYAGSRKVDFVFAYGGASNVLYANSELDVTNEVLDQLNAEYEKKGKK